MPSKLLARIRIPGEPSIIVEFPEKDRDQGSQACDCDDHHEKVEEATPALTDRDLVSGHPREEELLNTWSMFYKSLFSGNLARVISDLWEIGFNGNMLTFAERAGLKTVFVKFY